MGERFDMSRPIYAQIVERLKAKILAGIYPPCLLYTSPSPRD